VTAGPDTIPAAFRDQVRRSPARRAVLDEAGHLTYAELDERSDRVAASLIGRGFRRGDVGVLLADRSRQAIAGLLGVLKAGGAYLPLDVTHPRRHIERIVAAGAPAAVLAGAAAIRGGVGPAIGGHPVIDLDGGGPPRPAPPAGEVAPGDLAYVIYTSGSTGEPKGTLNEHRAVLALVESLRESVLAVHGDALRVAMVASLAFDASVQQVFSALLLGHTLCIVPEAARRDPWRLVEFYRRHRIDVTDGTPAHLAMLCQVRDDRGGALPVRQYLIGGEALRPDVVAQFRARWCAPGARITNVYGVAECAVDSTSYLVDDAEVERLGFVPIGRPLPHADLSIRDGALARVRPGVRGELCIGGPGVGRGYLGDPAQTAERFVSDPERPDWRLYRTGDLARELPDGTLEYCGRADRQVSLRGHRIELAEVEAALLRYSRREASGATAPRAVRCERCVLDSTYPGLTIEQGVCSVCRLHDRTRGALDRYFGTPADFRALMDRARARGSGEADCLLQFSGGKDSTYVLYRLIDMGVRVQTFTFDNGYISDTAFENIRRITGELGVEHVNGRVAGMHTVFSESLRNDSTVCSGCFRGLTAVSTRLAQERGIGMVLTGLSRGQIAETKLKPLLEAGIADVAEIDRRLVTHRKLYHARGDRTSRLLNVAVRIDAIDEMDFVDYFRYDPVTTREIRAFLAERSAYWREPKDTGFCSTNCRINEVGIYVHRLQRGFHNYAAPLSWDCRLDVMPREDAIHELGEVVDEDAVRGILGQIGYEPAARAGAIRDVAVIVRAQAGGEPRLSAYYTADRSVDPEALRAWLRRELPEHMVPAHLVRLDAMPVTVSGKTDHEALAAMAPDRGAGAPAAGPAGTETERLLTRLWAEALDVPRDGLGVEDDFFVLGGSSLTATVVVGLVARELGVRLSVVEAFADPTVRGLAGVIDRRLAGGGEAAGGERGGGPAALLAGDAEAMPGLFLCPDVSGALQSYVPVAGRLAAACASWRLAAGSEPELPAPIEAVGAAIADAVQRLRGRPPCLLGGWSFGGVLALEAAAELERRGDRAGLLVVIDADVPDVLRWGAARRQAMAALAALLDERPRDLRAAWRQVRRLVEVDGRLDLADVLGRLPADLLDAGIAAAAPSPAAQLDLAGRVLDRVDALARYAIRGPVDCPLLFVAAADSGRDVSQREGWSRLTAGAFSHAVVPGDHLSLVREPHAGELAAAIVRHLPAGG